MNTFEFLTNIIRSRRSVYANEFQKKEIPQKILDEILTNATWAPTHKMTEPWRFITLKEKVLTELGDFLSDYYKQTFPERYDYLKEYPKKATCVIVIILETHPNKNIPEWEEIAAVSCAVQNMWLSCHACGLGAYWDSAPASISFGNKFLSNENQKCLGLFYIGYYNETPTNRKRKKLNKIVREYCSSA